MPSSLEIGAIPRGDLAEARTKGILHCFKVASVLSNKNLIGDFYPK